MLIDVRECCCDLTIFGGIGNRLLFVGQLQALLYSRFHRRKQKDRKDNSLLILIASIDWRFMPLSPKRVMFFIDVLLEDIENVHLLDIEISALEYPAPPTCPGHWLL